MGDTLKVVIPAVIALAGTIFTVFIGYRQWKRQQDAGRESEFRSQKQRTHKELWEKLEDVHVRLRTEILGGEDFLSLVRDVNSYILKHSLYLERDDQALANRYMTEVRKLSELVASCDADSAKQDFHKTAEIAPKLTENLRNVVKIQSEVNQIREVILKRYRKVLIGDSNV
jgi:hypothetical protein